MCSRTLHIFYYLLSGHRDQLIGHALIKLVEFSGVPIVGRCPLVYVALSCSQLREASLPQGLTPVSSARYMCASAFCRGVAHHYYYSDLTGVANAPLTVVWGFDPRQRIKFFFPLWCLLASRKALSIERA